MALDGDVQQTIMADIGSGTKPEQSRLRYTPEMTAWRQQVEGEFEALRGKHPNASIDIPSELPRDDIKVQFPTGWDVRGDGGQQASSAPAQPDQPDQTKGAE